MDASQAASNVLTAVSEGEITLIEAPTCLMGLIDSYRRTLELTEIEERLQALETMNAQLQARISKLEKNIKPRKKLYNIYWANGTFVGEYWT